MVGKKGSTCDEYPRRKFPTVTLRRRPMPQQIEAHPTRNEMTVAPMTPTPIPAATTTKRKKYSQDASIQSICAGGDAAFASDGGAGAVSTVFAFMDERWRWSDYSGGRCVAQ